MPQGWTPVKEAPKGWTPVQEAPDPARPAGLPAGVKLQGFKPAAPVNMDAQLPGNIFTSAHPLDTLKANATEAVPQLADLGKGIVKGGIHTMAGLDNFNAKHLPAWFTTPLGSAGNTTLSDLVTGETPQKRSLRVTQELATPHNAMQSLGRGVEQASEFLIPGAGEEALASKIASVAPKLAKLGRIGVKALGSGAVNATQGGSFLGGAAMGGIGEGVALGAKALAPVIAEKALGIRAVDRAYKRTPGQAILAETRGVRPGNIADQAHTKVAGYSSELDNNALQSTAPVDLLPARKAASSFQKTANLQNNEDEIRDVATISKQLMERGGTPIPSTVSAHEGLALKRGLGSLTDYNPTMTQGLGDTAVKGTIAAMQPELASAIPGYESLNSKISTLLPAAKRAGATDLNESLAARVLTRVGAKTGALAPALAGAGIGGGVGYKEHGIPGALAGGAFGLIAPELLTNPTTLMTLARIGSDPALRAAVPMMTGAAMQFGRKK